MSLININKKQIRAEISNLVMYHKQMRLERLYNDQTKNVYRGAQKNSNTLQPMDRISC